MTDRTLQFCACAIAEAFKKGLFPFSVHKVPLITIRSGAVVAAAEEKKLAKYSCLDGHSSTPIAIAIETLSAIKVPGLFEGP